MFPMADALGLKTPNWLADEMLIQSDLMSLSNYWYKNISDSLAMLMGASSGTVDVILHGLRLKWSTSMTCTLESGFALGIGGRYLDSDENWGYVAEAFSHFSVFNPADVAVAFNTGNGLQRIDILEIRPLRTDSDLASRKFRDPITEAISDVNMYTRVIYNMEYHIKLGTPGSNAPAKDAGWIKVAEITVPAGATVLSDSNIKDIRQSASWTTEAASIKVGTSPLHVNWGTDTEDVEHANLIPLGVVPTNQTPTGGTASSLTKTTKVFSAIDTLFARLIDLSGVQNDAIKQRHLDGTELLTKILGIDGPASGIYAQYAERVPVPNIQLFTSGTGTWTVPAGVTSILVLLVGGGGGGGGGGTSNTNFTGGGGGGGTLLTPAGFQHLSVTPGQEIAYSIGAGGAGGAAASVGGDGGTTTFGALSAAGGMGGNKVVGDILFGAGGLGPSGVIGSDPGTGGSVMQLQFSTLSPYGFQAYRTHGGKGGGAGGRGGDYRNYAPYTATSGNYGGGGGGGGAVGAAGEATTASPGAPGGDGLIVILY